MERDYIDEKTFDKKDFSLKPLPVGDYESCTFLNCNFSNSTLSKINFSDCTFSGCNLSMAKIVQTSFQNGKFSDCKLTGLHFENCNQFLLTASFTTCQLNLSSFYKLKIKSTTFKNSNLSEADFTETDLTGGLFENCDLKNAIFENTIVKKVDFRTPYNYSINPEYSHIKLPNRTVISKFFYIRQERIIKCVSANGGTITNNKQLFFSPCNGHIHPAIVF